MATSRIAFRLTVYAPRVEDPTETTVLTPVAGAAHSNPFVLTSIQGVAGAKPYLGIPKGRQGAIDPITKKLSTGNLSLQVFDPRVTPGGANAERWVTAFLGDALGRPRLKGCRFTLERSLDGGETWAPYFTGRIRDVSLASTQWFVLDLKDFADDLSRKVFAAAPDASVASYAACASLLPVGVPQVYGTFTPTARLRGQLTYEFSSSDPVYPYSAGIVRFDLTQDPSLGLITKAAKDSSFNATPRIVQMKDLSTGAIGYYVWPEWSFGTELAIPSRGVTHYRYDSVGVKTLPPGDLRYAPLPSVNPAVKTPVELYVFLDGPPTKDAPILVNDVHPVQHWADMLDGKFSRLPGDTTLRPLAARDTSPGGPWDVLISDPSFGTDRYLVEASAKANEHIEKFICQRHNLVYRFDELGRVVPIDLRRTPDLGSVPILTDDDLADGTDPKWDDSRDGAITAVNVSYYVEQSVTRDEILASADRYPGLPATMVKSTKSSVLILNDLSTLRDVGEKIIEIDALGARAADGEMSATSAPRIEAVKARIAATVQDFLRPFASGTVKASLSYRFAGGAASVRQGDYRIIQHTKLPDPTTNQRGGPRLVLCLSRDEQDNRITIEWLDCGENLVALVPVLGVVTASAAPNRIDVPVTLNAAGDPAEVWTCVTETSVAVRPAETAAAWSYAGLRTASGSLNEGPLPGGKRIWVRARSQGKGNALRLPSVWTYPAGSGYVDLAGLAVPTSPAVTSVFANRVDFSWELSDTTLDLELFLVAGGVPATWTPSMRLRGLLAGTTTARVGNLTALTQYTVGVRHSEVSGGASGMATVTFATGSMNGIAPNPAGIALALGGVV